MIVKSKDHEGHMLALRKFFERIRFYKLWLNPKKCTFGVTSGKLLGFIVSQRGIEADLDKIKAIVEMKTPRPKKWIRGFLERIQYISRFIAQLTMTCEPIFRLLKKEVPIVWNEQCQDTAMEALLAQYLEETRKENAIYYISKKMLPYEFTIRENMRSTCLGNPQT